MAKLIDIEGVGPIIAEKLKLAGISSTDSLLKSGGTPKGRTEIAQKTGYSEKQVLEWVNRVDLFRIKGIAGQYSDLLEKAGVDTVTELALRNPGNLYQTMLKINLEKNLVRRIPAESQVAGWIKQAKTLPRMITY